MNLVEVENGTYINLDQLCLLRITKAHPASPARERLFRLHVALPLTSNFDSANVFELGNGFATQEAAVAEMVSYVQGERAVNRR